MPVSVHLPTRIDVDAAALLSDDGLFESAVAAGLERALRESRKVVLEPRGAFVRTRSGFPEVSWGGSGLFAIPAARRESIEARIASIWDGAAGVAEAGGSRSPGIEFAPAEPPDDDRYAHALGLYSTPSYGGSGKKVNVPVSKRGDGIKHRPGTRLGAAWRPIRAGQLGNALAAHRERRGLPQPTTGYIGAIAQVVSEGLTIALFKMPEGTLAFGIRLRDLFTVEYDPNAREWATRPADLSPELPYSVSWIANASGAKEKLTVHYTRIVAKVLEQYRMATKSDAEFAASVKERVDLIVASELEQMTGVKSLLELRAYELTYLVKANIEIPTDVRDVPLEPIAELKQLKARGSADGKKSKGRGKGAGSGEGEGEGKGKAAGETEGEDGEDSGGQKGGGKTGEGESGEATEAREQGFIEAQPSEEAVSGGVLFPVVPGSDSVTLTCQSYLGEPKVDDLGAAGERLKALIEQIAFKLQIPTCAYAGTFLLNAATAIGVRSQEVARWRTDEAAVTSIAPDGKGDVGQLKVSTVATPQIQLLRHLATVVPFISFLDSLIKQTYDANPNAITGTWHGRPISWWLRWHSEVMDEMGNGIGDLFASTCQVVFVQLLNASRKEIRKRLDGIDGFARTFEQVVLPQLVGVDELLHMRDLLKAAPTIAWMSSRADYALYARAQYPDVRLATESPLPRKEPMAKASTWREATESLAASLQPLPKQPEPDLADHYELVIQVDGSYRILDKKRRLWDLDGLETSILLKRGSVEAMEPLVKQFVELPDVMERFSKPGISIKAELKELLEEMLAKNELIGFRAASDHHFGFDASRIMETHQNPTVHGALYALQGVHKLAHDQIGEFFRGDEFYPLGIDHLFSVELGETALVSFFEFTGIVLLAVLCPPLAVVVGIEVAAYHYGEAAEHERIYESLIDPELVKSRAEIEAELFAAELGLALSFLPVAGEIMSEARVALRLALRGAQTAEEATAAGARQASVWTAEGMAAHLARTLEAGLVEKFAEELTKAWLINKAIEWAITPVMQSLQEEVVAKGPAGGMQGALNTVLSRMAAKRALHERASQAGAR